MSANVNWYMFVCALVPQVHLEYCIIVFCLFVCLCVVLRLASSATSTRTLTCKWSYSLLSHKVIFGTRLSVRQTIGACHIHPTSITYVYPLPEFCVSGSAISSDAFISTEQQPLCVFYWRASKASETLSGVTNGNRRYILIYIYVWYVPDTLVAQARWYVMWGELSVNYFLKHSNHLKPTQNVIKWNRALWLLFNIQFLTTSLLLWWK